MKGVRHCCGFGGVNRLLFGDGETALRQMAVQVLQLKDWNRLAVKLDLFLGAG